MYGISAGMSHISGFKIIHSNLTTKNVLVDESVMRSITNARKMLIAKVSDFGLRSSLKKKSNALLSTSTRPTNMIRWKSPEALKETERISTKSDVWSFGVVMWEIMSECKCIPYTNMHNAEVIDYVLKNRNILDQPKECPDFIYELMKKCFTYEENGRPDFLALHDHFSKYIAPPNNNDTEGTITTTTSVGGGFGGGGREYAQYFDMNVQPAASMYARYNLVQ
eukprot:TRINITY_DN941_c0_g4_i1.p1 TRINITY_DN941_c0_g4~~TRINITY_DN941_c0_g4_i1.p1  ORF type:complete len:223 (-),score=55.97 TRINITY_DN941_c0_g4_i1:238-906(-)